MNVAIWGLGKHGSELYLCTKLLPNPDFRVTCLIDADEKILASYRNDNDIVSLSPSKIPDGYKQHLFDAVMIGSVKPEYCRQMRYRLEEIGIPELKEKDLLGSFDLKLDLVDVSEALKIDARLLDRESKALYRALLYKLIREDERPFLETLWAYKTDRHFFMWDLYHPMERCNAKRVILFGSGWNCKFNLNAVRMCSLPVAAVCVLGSSDNTEGFLYGEKKISPYDLLSEEYEDCLVVISSQKQRDEIRRMLSELSFPKDRIYDPPNRYRPVLSGYRRAQYFDVWKPEKHEVFVDCGTYDGQTLVNFQKWAGEYDAIYALEPMPEMQTVIVKKAEKMKNLTLFQAAAWDKEEQLSFQIEDDPSGSGVLTGDSGTCKTITVQGMALDELISGRISFLKMDIEGSELAAINGAAGLIQKWKPRLAICIYHKPDDVLEIPGRILDLVPEYSFKIRHYSAGLYETVLYASIDNDIWIDEH